MDKQLFCKYCGKKIEVENAIFCTGCGKRLDDEPVKEQEKSAEEKDPVKEVKEEQEKTESIAKETQPAGNEKCDDDDPKKPVSIVKVALIVFASLLALSLIGIGIYKLATRSIVEDEVNIDDNDGGDDVIAANPTDTPDEPEPTKEAPIITLGNPPEPTIEPVVAASVPGSDDTDPNGLHIYKIVIDDVTWEEACRDTKTLFGDEGGYLVHINTKEEYDYIVDFIKKAGYEDRIFWIGAKRLESPAVYKWVDQDGNLVGDNLNNLEYWLEGEPSFYDDSTSTFETCVEMFYSKKNKKWVFNDVQNDVLELLPSYTGKMGYIIEID